MAQTSTALVLYQPYPNKNLAEYIRAVQESHNAYTAQLSATGQLPALMALPVELFMQIYDLLTVESQAMLAVTCKSLYRSMFPHVAIKQVKHRGGMLRCIERQMPQQYYCPACVKLHRWHLDDDGRPVFPTCDDMTPSCGVTRWLFPSDPGPYAEGSPETVDYEVDYRTARLAVRAAALGPSFGPPLSILEKRAAWQPCPDMADQHGPLLNAVAVGYHYEPRVVDGVLHVRATYVVRDNSGSPDLWNLWAKKPDLGPWICPGRKVFAEFEGQAGRCLCFEDVPGTDVDVESCSDVEEVVECSCAKTLAEVCALAIRTVSRCECAAWASQYCGTEWEITKTPSPAGSGAWELRWQVWRRFDVLTECGLHEWFRDPYFDEGDDGRWMCPYYGLKPGARRAWLLAEAAERGDDQEAVEAQLAEDEERMTESDLSEYDEARWLQVMWEEAGQWFEEKPQTVWGQEVDWEHWY
ncbi:hypothetical protein MCOR02_011672 [Pyricularia oryzae]|nr:hypothetical protein MCOR02_011672 [Pyricularia oryzae]KAI6263012.1 hypothetical protein MCOR19_000825 [Pyricularia oryzae]KAI6319171.1 hypothetical protein MCOR34_003356 [Pyricularia oryzae]KAI6413712.1 hypothetical protein MCOR20_002628 [Pyricularia oryzae]KAI6448732.1 hypothetical protein MCOR15_009879 [Pyricularia oryzae]